MPEMHDHTVDRQQLDIVRSETALHALSTPAIERKGLWHSVD